MLERHRTDSGLTFYISPLLRTVGVPHAFSTRLGGVSQSPFDSLNLGMLGDGQLQDDAANIAENYRRFRAGIGCEHRDRCWVHQVHGPEVCTIKPGDIFENGVKADALVLSDATRLVSVKFADCVPILLSTADGKTVAAVHSGWRGVIAGVIPATVQKLIEFTGNDAASLVAAIGPCIGFDHFEVGSEVLVAFTSLFGKDAPIRITGHKGFIDLQQAVRMQLIRLGLSTDKIDTNTLCTFRDRDEFFSHRRDAGITGRMAALIGPRSA